MPLLPFSHNPLTTPYYTFQIIPTASCSTKVQSHMVSVIVSSGTLSLSSQLDEMLQDIFPVVLNFVLGGDGQCSHSLWLAEGWGQQRSNLPRQASFVKDQLGIACSCQSLSSCPRRQSHAGRWWLQGNIVGIAP